LPPFFNPGNIHINGFSINVICLPKEREVVTGLIEACDVSEHPCRELSMSKFAPGLPVLNY
jgi:hypothetical protein